MRNLRLAALALTCLTVPLAFAQKAPGGLYGELGYTMVTVSPTTLPDFKPSALRGIVGYQVNSNLSVEGMLGMGMSDGTATITANNASATANVKVDSMYGVYGKVKAELAPGFEAFGRAGYSKSNAVLSVSSFGYSQSNSTDGFSWGVGAAFAVSPSVSVTVDYMSYASKDDVKVTGPTFGVAFKF